ncbi:hypothetical protein [Streptomyces sp. YIM 98790]|uniref:hypothetical protein n=1 Tax=Streptomyces sp. YIM 98790 TaxID=2689077 RepID=UPI001408573D|nr:hypothetical protein [Streptomyces sp. YIM 98790]
MARIRTVKPEMFISESLAEVSLTAERTFVGLLTLADDQGRFRDHPAIIAGRLWPLRPEHTPAHVEGDLDQLARAGLICRYSGCDGRTYGHIVTWERHQRIDRPSAPRSPRCPVHQAALRCGGCGEASCSRSASPAPVAPVVAPPSPGPAPASERLVEGSTSRTGVPDHPIEPDSHLAGPPVSGSLPVMAESSAAPSLAWGESPGQPSVVGESQEARRGFVEGSVSGSRILDPGSVPSGRSAPAPGTVSQEVSAGSLLAEYVTACVRRPPKDVLGHLGRQVRTLLEEGFEAEALRVALERQRAKGLHPSVLPSLVHEVVNASPASDPPSAVVPAGPWAAVRQAYQPWTNPADASVYEEAL